MRKTSSLFSATLVGVALSAGGHGVARAQDAPLGDAAEGKRLYLATGCFTCHGRSGQGGAMKFDGFMGQLRQPINEMPAYSEIVMSDKQIADIYAFVQTLPGPLPTKDMAIFKD